MAAGLPHSALQPHCCPAVAKLCQQAGIAHIINNAYGVQSAALCAQVTRAREWHGVLQALCDKACCLCNNEEPRTV